MRAYPKLNGRAWFSEGTSIRVLDFRMGDGSLPTEDDMRRWGYRPYRGRRGSISFIIRWRYYHKHRPPFVGRPDPADYPHDI